MKFECSDGIVLEAHVEILRRSPKIKQLLKTCRAMGEDVIFLDGVRSHIFEKVLEWAAVHEAVAEVHKSGADSALPLSLNEWDTQFLQTDRLTLIELTHAAHYLQMKDLLDLACQTIAESIAGRNINVLRKFLDQAG